MADIKMPQLGESVTEGTIGKWLKQVGDSVSKYEPIAEVITDKVTAEVPSDFDGVMEELLIAEGDTVSVGTVICTIATEADAALSVTGEAAEEVTAYESGTDTAHDDEERVTRQTGLDSRHPSDTGGVSETKSNSPSRGRFSPAVLRLADEHDVNLSDITGTGEGGRITRRDVLAFAEKRASASTETRVKRSETHNVQPADVDDRLQPRGGQTGLTSPGTSTPVDDLESNDEWIVPSPIRRTIAKRMVESKHNAPHAWTMVEADVTKLVEFRNRVKGDFKRREGIDLTYLPFFIKAVVEAVKRHPVMNASWIDDKIVMHRHINISIAVATDDVLVVPVIHDADRLSVSGLAHKVVELAAKARSGRLAMADVQGGTFTVNNTGAFGSILSQPILNAPQAGILSVESIVKRPVVIADDAIAVRSVVNLCLSLDHRVLDGWVAGQFLRAVRERLESFDAETVLY